MGCFYYRQGSCLALPPERIESTGLFFRTSVPVYPSCSYNSDVHIALHGMVVTVSGKKIEKKMSDCPMYKAVRQTE